MSKSGELEVSGALSMKREVDVFRGGSPVTHSGDPYKVGELKGGTPPFLRPTVLVSRGCEAGTEENRALVAPGSGGVKHISYRLICYQVSRPGN